jgi:serine/threonine protein kinase
MSTNSLTGRTLGKYHLLELIGKGGMATVYKGLQPDVDRYVAIKVLPPHLGQDATYGERFRLEARTIARLQHPHIMPLYDYGTEGDILYLITPFIEGGSLTDRIRKGARPLAEVDRLLTQIAPALDYAHRQGVIHRDIKPDNVMIDGEGHALLADFGIARLAESAGPNLTGTGGLIGTPAYMSPEQAQGMPVDARSDIYSLGVVVFELVTGTKPYADDTAMQLVLKHINAPVPALREFAPNASPELEAVLQKALMKDPADRYQTAGEFAAAFSRAANTQAEPLETVIFNASNLPGTTTRDKPTSTAGGTSGSYVLPGGTVSSNLPPGTIVVRQGGLNNPVVLLGGFAIIAVLVVVIVLILARPPVEIATEQAGIATTVPATARPTLPPAPNVPVFGAGFFSTLSSPGDSLNVRVEGLTRLQSGERYFAWLANTDSGETLSMGPITLDPMGNGLLAYTEPNGTFLAGRFNALLVAAQTAASDVPGDDIAYSASVPVEINRALNSILVDVDIPAEDGRRAFSGRSLLDGALNEAEIGAAHAGLAANSSTVGSMHLHNEHTINILSGTSTDYNGDNSGDNPGLGFGLGFFFDRISEKLNDSAEAANTAVVQAQVDLIRVCVNNAVIWRDEVLRLENELLAIDDLALAQERLERSAELARFIIEGNDLNNNGTVEPFEGECGLTQIEQYGIAVANLTLVEGAPEDLPALLPVSLSADGPAPVLPTATPYDGGGEN